jgi:cytochrome P450
MTNLPKSPRNDTIMDISSLAFWNKSFQERDESFARLRAAAPVTWHLPIEVDYPHDEPGFWAVTLAEDISEASRNAEVFPSRFGSASTRSPEATREARCPFSVWTNRTTAVIALW